MYLEDDGGERTGQGWPGGCARPDESRMTAMVSAWVADEMATVDLKDRRLNKRLGEVLSQLGGQPTSGIPAACGGHAEMTAAYRLFDNAKARFEGILKPHGEATRRRLAEEPVALLVQDTTEVDVTRPSQQVVGAGPLDGGARWGVLLHVLHAFRPDGTPLGTVDALAWAREEGVRRRSLTRAERGRMPIEEKESHRWVEMMRRAGEAARQSPGTQLVCLADSEADIYEVLAEGTAGAQGVGWIIRACQDRAVEGETAGRRVTDEVLAQPVLFRQQIRVRGRQAKVQCETRGRRQPRGSRKAEVEVRAKRVRLRPPWRAQRRLPAVTVNVVFVREVSPPMEDAAVEWQLVTSLPIEAIDQVRQVIQYYCVRWMIEVFFRVLKSGCRVEQRRFEHLDRLLPCLAVYLIVAWRTLFVCRLARSGPEMSCEAVFEPAEWKAVWQVVHRTAPPRTPPSLVEMVGLVAQLGGYVNRRGAGPPGPQTVWIGLQRTYDFALGWRLFGPEAQNGAKHV